MMRLRNWPRKIRRVKKSMSWNPKVWIATSNKMMFRVPAMIRIAMFILTCGLKVLLKISDSI